VQTLRPPTIFLIEDDEDDYILTKEIINEIPVNIYKLEWASNYEEGLNAMKSNSFDVFLLDYRLGKDSGLDLLKKMNFVVESGPIILLTGQGDRELDFEALEAGASDFLVKADLNPDLLDRSIRYAIQQFKTIRQLRKKEDELQQLNANLEVLVQNRTAELNYANNELKKAFEIERELSQLKGKLVSMASHEFKTPLSTILSSISLVERYTELDDIEKRTKHIDRIKSAVNNLNNILNDFLSLEKIESGFMARELVTINVSEFIQSIIDELNSLLQQDQVIEFSHKGKSEILADKHTLKNILINLLSNAVKYSSEGKEIILKTHCLPDALKIEVTDYGIGIPTEDKAHMFERFFRASNAINYQGTGLGLTIVKRYLDLLGGSIRFDSELNKGTSFFVHLPLISDEAV
jgi:signal transduction histidine kinase